MPCVPRVPAKQEKEPVDEDRGKGGETNPTSWREIWPDLEEFLGPKDFVQRARLLKDPTAERVQEVIEKVMESGFAPGLYPDEQEKESNQYRYLKKMIFVVSLVLNEDVSVTPVHIIKSAAESASMTYTFLRQLARAARSPRVKDHGASKVAEVLRGYEPKDSPTRRPNPSTLLLPYMYFTHVRAHTDPEPAVAYLKHCYKGDVNAQLPGDTTLLMLASHMGNINLVKRLLEEPTINVNMVNETGRSAIHSLLETGQYEILELMLKDGRADVNLRDEEGIIPLMRATLCTLWTPNTSPAEGRDKDRKGPSHDNMASRLVVRLLEVPEIDLTAHAKRGGYKSITYWLLYNWSSKNGADVIRALNKRVPDLTPAHVEHGFPPLIHAAARSSQVEVMQWYLAHPDVDVTVRNKTNGLEWTMMHEAAKHKAYHILRVLLKDPRTRPLLDATELTGKLFTYWMEPRMIGRNKEAQALLKEIVALRESIHSEKLAEADRIAELLISEEEATKAGQAGTKSQKKKSKQKKNKGKAKVAEDDPPASASNSGTSSSAPPPPPKKEEEPDPEADQDVSEHCEGGKDSTSVEGQNDEACEPGEVAALVSQLVNGTDSSTVPEARADEEDPGLPAASPQEAARLKNRQHKARQKARRQQAVTEALAALEASLLKTGTAEQLSAALKTAEDVEKWDKECVLTKSLEAASARLVELQREELQTPALSSPGHGDKARSAHQEGMCVICLDTQACISFVHGKSCHLCCCEKCADDYTKTDTRCPVCRVEYQTTLQTFST